MDGDFKMSLGRAHPIPDDVLTDHMAVLAKTGAGKTYGAKGIVERLARQKRRICIVDPKDAWWGLKSSADGKATGYPFIVFGGPHADVPLLASHGKVLGEAIATSDMLSIICTKSMPEAERIRFLLDFFQTLNIKNQAPLHLILDEAHMMAPQKPLGEMQRLTHWTSELVSGGRGMGFRVMLLSQRPARLNKDVLTQCESLVAMRMTGPQDRDAVKAWIDDQADRATGKEIISSLPSLPTGEGWFWAPTRGILERIKFPAIETYDSSKTQKDGKADERAKLAPVDLTALQAKLGKAQAEIEANDPAALKRKVAELQKALQAKTPTVAKGITREDEVRLRSEGYNAGWEAAMKESAKLQAATTKTMSAISAALARVQSLIPDAPQPVQSAAPRAPTPAAVRPIAPRPAPVAQAVAPEGLSSRHMRILNAVAWWKAAGIEEPSRAQVAGAAGYASGNGNFNNLVGAVKTASLIEYPTPGTVRLTDAGEATAEAQSAPTTEELHDRVRSILESRHVKLFDAVVSAYPEPLTREQLAEATGYQAGNGNFNNLVGKLSTLEIVTYPQPGSVRAAEWLFL